MDRVSKTKHVLRDAVWLCLGLIAYAGYLFATESETTPATIIFRLWLILGGLIGLIIILISLRIVSVKRHPVGEPIPDRKPVIIDLLQLLSSENEQLAYETNVSHVDITVELICMWFNDLYWPDDEFFISCFTQDELNALAQFDQYYRDRKSQLPESQGTVRTWLASPVWREIMLEASRTLEQIDA